MSTELTDFEKKLPLYKTAFSPSFGTFVGIKHVFFNEDWQEWCIQATVAGHGKHKLFTFIPSDLQDYCL